MLEKFGEQDFRSIFKQVTPNDIISEVEWALEPEIKIGTFRKPEGDDKLTYWLTEDVFKAAVAIFLVKNIVFQATVPENDPKRMRLGITLGVFVILKEEMSKN